MASRETNPALRTTRRSVTVALAAASLTAGGLGIHLAQSHHPASAGVAATSAQTPSSAAASETTAAAATTGSAAVDASFSTVTPVASTTRAAVTATRAS